MFTLIIISCSSQRVEFLDPDTFLIEDKKPTKVLLVGSWHFNYPGLDAHTPETENRINILSDEKQNELEELLNYISKFRPTKIVVESGQNTGYLKYNYKQYLNGKAKLYANERSQIGMRLVDRFKLDTIYGINAVPLLLELKSEELKDSIKNQNYLTQILKRHYFGGSDEISNRYSQFYEYKSRMTVKRTLLENFKYINSEKVLNRGFGAYISGGQFISDEFEGPDALSMYWFNRNLRIYRKIQKIDYNENDRILVLFGAGHISILRYLFNASPQFQLIDFNKL